MKMKRNIIAIIALSLGLTSCDDLLNLSPMSDITQTDYFKTETDLQLFSNSFYNNLLDKSPYDDQSDLYIQQTLSDEMLGGTKRVVPASGGGWTWTDLRKMNTLLAYVDQCEDEDAVIKYTALTRFFRAYFYFEKVKRFGDVPWYDVELGSDDEALYKPRDSREYVMTKMIEDIDYAINNLPDMNEEKSSPFRVNKWAALALKAQFCLYEGTYRKYHQLNIEGNTYTYYLDLAAKAAKDIIDNGPYKLYSTGNPNTGIYVKGTDDPRILLYYNPVSITNKYSGNKDENRYLGTDLTVSDEATEYYNSQAVDAFGNTGFSQITQKGFFWENDKFDMLIMSSPEIHFLKAEAYLMGYGVQADENKAKEEFLKAVSQSIKLYYYYDLNSTGENSRKYDSPTDDEINLFAESKWVDTKYENKQDAIITQKWLHFAITASREAWSDLRRTGYPSGLVFPEVAGTIPNVPTRWKYPTTEMDYNPYYKDVQSEDTYYTKLFWAK